MSASSSFRIDQGVDHLVVGGGFAGCVLAERLASQLGRRVLIIDRRDHIGGNAYDCLDDAGILMHRYGPHIFHTNSQRVMDYLSQFTEWRPYEHRVLAQTMSALLAAHQVMLHIQEVDYEEWHSGDAVSDIWLNSANFTLPLDFSLFTHLYEVPLLQKCIPRDWQADATQWRAGEMNLAAWCQQLLAGKAIVPLIHHWLMIQGQRSMRGLRMNTLGWFDFKSAWFAPPDP